jgi:hypothetical protein
LAILSWYSSGFSTRWSSNALSIGGVIVLQRPTPFGGALVIPKHYRFNCIFCTERVLQRTVLAIVALANLLIIMSLICVYWDTARLGAIVVVLGQLSGWWIWGGEVLRWL